MPTFRIPFGRRVEAKEAKGTFDAGVALAFAADALGVEEGVREGWIETSWGSVHAEVNPRGLVMVSLPSHEESNRPVMLQAACRVLGVPAGPVQETGVEMRVVDVGREVLVMPVVSEEALEALPESVDVSGVPGHDPVSGIAYVHTQSSPYARVSVRALGEGDVLGLMGAVGVHLVRSGGLRATFPRTRIVGSLVGDEEEECEVVVQARKAGGEAVIDRVLVGGEVSLVSG